MPKKLTEKFVRQFIENKGGILDDDWYYEGAYGRFWVTCEKGHRWKTTYSNIYRNWCLKCGNESKKISANIVRKFIENKGGTLDKDWKYEGAFGIFSIKCKKDHIWETCWSTIQKECWCPVCGHKKGRKKLRKNEEEIRTFIKNKHGTLDDNFKYINGRTKFWVTCKNKHRWKVTWFNISRGCWCPYCKKSKTEQEFRRIIEKLLGFSFPTKRPKWMRRNKKNWHTGLEFDGYNKKHKIAFEYQGFQHYETAPFDNYSKKGLKERQERDIFKKEQCEKRGICLIRVPYWIPKSKWRMGIKNKYKKWKVENDKSFF